MAANGDQTQSLLGREVFDNIEEAMLPSVSPNHKTFLVKKFSNSVSYRWFVESVTLISPHSVVPAVYAVLLSEKNTSFPEEYLRQTLKKTKHTVNQHLWQGVLVEVDYGFVQRIGKKNGELRTNKRYSDTRQHGEMHKRRLAVVVKTTGTLIQVAPVTSDTKSASDKTCFELSTQTLSGLDFYGSSGKQSWVLCNMLETVSASRILPPVSHYTAKLGALQKKGRNVAYPSKLNAAEQKLLKAALLHSIGVTDYAQMTTELANLRQQCKQLASLTLANGQMAAQIADLNAEVATLKLVEEVAKDWEKNMGSVGQLAEKVMELQKLYAEM